MNKKLYLYFALMVTTVLAGCTLYMDDPEDLRVLRTEEGYLEPETVELPGDMGTLTYQYNQKTIAIEDEVEQWIDHVDHDTIVYFSKDTPDYFLPEVGEMMTCSFREKFPHGFCHRCTERTEADDLYRCVFTRCSVEDAFDEFHCEFDSDEGIDLTPEEYRLTEEEFDSIMTDSPDDEIYEVEGESRLTRADERPVTRLEFGDKNWHKKSINFKIPELDLKLVGSAGGYAESGKTNSIKGGHVKLTAGVKGYVDVGLFSKPTIIFGLSMAGDYSIEYEASIYANSTIRSPVCVTPFGVAIDLVKISFELGFTVQPYFTTQETFMVTEGEIGLKFNFAAEFEKSSKYPNGHWTTAKNSTSRPVCKATFKPNTSNKLNVEAGLDCRFGVGEEALVEGASLAIGKKIYAKLTADLDKRNSKYSSAEEYAKQNANFVTYEQNYLEAQIEVASIFSLGGSFPGEEKLCKYLKIPLFPSVKTSSFYVGYLSSQTPTAYFMEAKLSDPGLVTSLLGYKPQMRVYKKKTGDLVQTFNLTTSFNKDGSTSRFYLTHKGPDFKIEENTPYTVQFGYEAYATWALEGDAFWIPLYDLPYEYVVSRASIPKSPKLRASQSSEKNNGNKPWVKGGVNYKYRYVIDTEVEITGAREVKSWGLEIKKKGGSKAEFDAPKKALGVATAKKTVRMYWYSNDKSVKLSAKAYAITPDPKQSFTTWSEEKEFVVTYSSSIDKTVTDAADYEGSK